MCRMVVSALGEPSEKAQRMQVGSEESYSGVAGKAVPLGQSVAKASDSERLHEKSQCLSPTLQNGCCSEGSAPVGQRSRPQPCHEKDGASGLL